MSDTAPARLQNVLETINTACVLVKRSPDTVNVVAVSKTFPADAIEPVLALGHTAFGENRVQEADEKWPALKDRFPGVQLHLIGPLQTNKARRALELFDVIQTVDRPKLARTLGRLMDETGLRPDVFIQVNTGEEDQKAGMMPSAVDDFVHLCRDELKMPVVGLMCIPPVDEDAALHFALLAKMATRNNLERLSMGMSADYDIAVQFGATDVRVGSAIFGTREAP